jgi:hypothetical protein
MLCSICLVDKLECKDFKSICRECKGEDKATEEIDAIKQEMLNSKQERNKKIKIKKQQRLEKFKEKFKFDDFFESEQ